jgi:hypothetical protein
VNTKVHNVNMWSQSCGCTDINSAPGHVTGTVVPISGTVVSLSIGTGFSNAVPN